MTLEDNLKIIKHNVVANNEWLEVVLLGDFHVGHKRCDEEAIEEAVKWIASKSPKETKVLLMGDLIENVIQGSKGTSFECVHPNPEDQMKIAIDLLKPITNTGHIIAMCDGNHEHRTERVTGVSLSKFMAKDLNVPYHGYHCLVDLGITYKKNTEQYLIYMEHGCGSIPKNMSGKYKRLEEIQSRVTADVFVKGHIHHKLAFPKVVWRMNKGRMERHKIMFASSGAYVIDPDYAIRSGFEPSEMGMTKLLLCGSRYNIHCTI